eukprot:COSAG02_NODE_4220_length_5616_cov_13.985862_6_plen_199_part_00
MRLRLSTAPGRMAKRGKKAAKAEAAKAEAAKAAANAEKSATPRSTSKGAAASQPGRDDRDDGGDQRQGGDSRGGDESTNGGDDGGSPGAAGAFEFVVTVLQCDGLKKAGRSGQASVFVGLSAGSASGQSAAVPYDGGRPQWNRGRGCVPAALTVAADIRFRVADSCSKCAARKWSWRFHRHRHPSKRSCGTRAADAMN